MGSILLIEDREGLRRVYAEYLRRQGHAVAEAGSVEKAVSLLADREFPLVITDYMLPGENGMTLLKQLREKDPEQLVIVMTAFGEVKLAVAAIKAGAFDFLEKPIDLDHLGIVVSRALQHHGVQRAEAFRQNRLEQEPGTSIVGDSAELKEVLALVEKVAPTDTTCLLLGESGVGKELFARHLHRHSRRAGRDMISINCASIPRELVESELFGHERGAFTGAVEKKVGLMEMAAKSTLFLDEIGELPLDLQPKLLRAIQTGEIMRVGGTRVIEVDTRLVCATNRNLEAGIREGWFREDLYYRLAVFPILIPPLRERAQDIPALLQFFLQKQRIAGLAPGLLAKLSEYHWPGNVRELENVIERAAILSQGEPLTEDCFPETLFAGKGRISLPVSLDLNRPLRENLDGLSAQVEHRFIQLVLQEENGHRERTARRLGLSVKTLYNKLKQNGTVDSG